MPIGNSPAGVHPLRIHGLSWLNTRRCSSGIMSLPASSVDFTGRARWRRAVLTVALGMAGVFAPATRADLVVLNAAGSASYLLRLDAATGGALEVFRQDTEGYYSLTLSSQNELFVSANTLGEYSLQVFGGASEFRGALAKNGQGLFNGTRGPDGAVYALAPDEDDLGSSQSLWRIDAQGAKRFVANGTGGMTAPISFVFGPDGDLYVGDIRAGVLRFSGARGLFVPLGSGGLQDVAKVMFGPDGRLYVASRQANAVLRFDGVTGQAIDTFVTAGSGGLVSPAGMAFGPDGTFYVTSAGTNQILRFDGVTGEARGVVATAAGILGDPRFRWRDLVFVPAIPPISGVEASDQ